MKVDQRVELFSALGKRVANMSETELDEISQRAYHENNWFTRDNIQLALKGITKLLDKNALSEWVSHYDLEVPPKTVGVVMAGNIPLVGFHDLLCVLMAGHHLAVKPSSNDTTLMKWIAHELTELEPELKKAIRFEERLNHVDAIIATGSDNSSRYFEYYFSKKPNIIRKNRTSCAVLQGGETPEEVESLGKDIFTYFGLGCRNVSKIYVPRDFDFTSFLDGLQPFDKVLDHHKYKNNYDYNKSIYLVNGAPHLDTAFALFREDDAMVSPISVIYYGFYNNEDHLHELLTGNRKKIQSVVGSHVEAEVSFGEAQFPAVTDYADGVDTLQFLSGLN